MEKTRHFRITLHLTHFFQDHRCMCKIFINKKMKYVADLENHIQEIFSLENFYLLSNGHYIPPTEDIRILQQDDVVVAIPKSHTNLPVYTSTPLSKNKNMIPKTKGKRKREIIEEFENEEVCISSNDKIDEKTRSKKKKKKNKTDICKKSLDEDVQTENNVDSPPINKKHQTMKNGDISNTKKNYEANIQEQRDDNTKQKESSDENISHPGFKTSEEKIQNELENSVKRKVLYFEKYSDLSDPTGKSEIVEDKILADENRKQEHHQENDEISENSIQEKGKDLDFRQKKLVVQKRNTELISYALPKKSNIVKSIVVTNSLPDKQVNLTINIPITSSDNDNLAASTKDFPEEKSNTFTNNLKHFTNDELKKKPLSELICPQATEKQRKSIQKCSIIGNKSLPNMQLSSATSNSQISNYENVIEPPYACNKNTPIEKCFIEPEEILTTSNKQTSKDIANSFSNNLLTENSMEYDQHDNVNDLRNDTSKDFPVDIDNISILSERDSSVSISFSSEKQSDHINYCETPSFITKRRRKRSHRKRKSKVCFENEHLQLNTMAESYRRAPNVIKTQTTPAIHIKFDDDEDICTPEENTSNAMKCIEEISLQKAQKNILPPTEKANKDLLIEEKQPLGSVEITENGDIDVTPHVPKNTNDNANAIAKTKELNEAMKTEDVLEKLDTYKNQITVCDDSIEEMTKAAACSTPLISEDIILKSPLMTSTKPKSSDIIAFKILRLAKNYTPELSKYIIGQVRSFNEENLNVNINVIDGEDQCKEPDGKFSVVEPKTDYSPAKSYRWNDLIEPRLIFP